MACSIENLATFSAEAKEEIGENKVDLPETVQNLRKMVAEKYPDLKLPPYPEDCDAFLETCLRVRKFDMDRAAEQVHSFFKFVKYLNAEKTFLPSLYKKDFFDTGVVTVLKNRDSLGRQILYFDFSKCPADKYDLDNVIPLFTLLKIELTRLSVDTQRIGLVYLINLDGFTLTHAKNLAIRLRPVLKLLTGSIPLRLKGIYEVNSPSYYHYTVDLFQPFWPKKMKERLKVYGEDASQMFDVISPDIIPTCVGGNSTLEECSDSEFMTNLLKNEVFYREFFRWGYMDSSCFDEELAELSKMDAVGNNDSHSTDL